MLSISITYSSIKLGCQSNYKENLQKLNDYSNTHKKRVMLNKTLKTLTHI